MDILEAVHSFCSHNKIQYSLGYGSLLGAVRHVGYIPWDDDIDIIMLREDYTKFENLFPATYEDRYSFGTINRMPSWPLSFGKVYDNRTIVYEQKALIEPIGVSIDVFPLDYVPDCGFLFFLNRIRFQFLCYCSRMKTFRITRKTSLLKRAIAFLVKTFLAFVSNSKIIHHIDHRSKVISRRGGNRVYYWPSVGKSKPIPESWFSPIISVSFERKSFCSVNNAGGYLKAMYGSEYMTPPQEKNRVSYHTNDAFWKDL